MEAKQMWAIGELVELANKLGREGVRVRGVTFGANGMELDHERVGVISAVELLAKLEDKIAKSEVGKELWLDAGEWRREKASAKTFAEWVNEVMERF